MLGRRAAGDGGWVEKERNRRCLPELVSALSSRNGGTLSGTESESEK
jgi:hypothetical protein